MSGLLIGVMAWSWWGWLSRFLPHPSFLAPDDIKARRRGLGLSSTARSGWLCGGTAHPAGRVRRSRSGLSILIAILATASIYWQLSGFGAKNMKRLLAYSSSLRRVIF
jgi:hypothetical protein